MKKLILIAIAFITLQAVAQDRQRGDSKGERPGKREMMKDMSPEDIATLGSKKMTLALDLNEKQQAEVKALLLTQAEDRKQKMEERKKMMADGDTKKPSTEERTKMMNEKLDHQIAMKKKMKSILTAEQYEKWEAMESERHQKEKGHRRGKPKH